MFSLLANSAIGSRVDAGHVTDLNHMTRHDALTTLLAGIAVLLIFGAHAANVWGISYKIRMNGKTPGQEGDRDEVTLGRVFTGLAALAGAYLIFKSATALLR